MTEKSRDFLLGRAVGSFVRQCGLAIGGSSGFLLLSCTSVADDSCWFSAVMTPGMIFRDLVFPLNPLDRDNLHVLSARRAEIGDPPDLLRISSLRYFARDRGCDRFELQARTSVYDIRRKLLEAANDFRAGGMGLRFEGSCLSGRLEDQIFDASGHLEIQMRPAAPIARFSRLTRKGGWPPFRLDSSDSSIFAAEHSMSLQALVHSFAGKLTEFLKCMRWVDELESRAEEEGVASVVVIAPGGGHLDLGRLDLQLAGQSMLVGPRAVIISAEGMRFRQESADGKNWIQITGQGGIKTTMDTTKSGEIWIAANTFSGVSDNQIVQFEGGPLKVCCQGSVLAATEDWQYVRVLANRRIILSPGNWNVEGNFNDQTE